MTSRKLSSGILSKAFIIELPHSKSISNRLLVLQHLYGKPSKISHLSISNDTTVLAKALLDIRNHAQQIDVEDCGAALRFLIPLLAITEGNWMLSGTSYLHTRSVGSLVDALRQIEAVISYQQTDGYAPVRINGRMLVGGEISIDGSMSSQFISALMMVAPALKKGLQIRINGKISSMPYISMTYKLMEQVGLDLQKLTVSNYKGEELFLKQSHRDIKEIEVEKDWSAAAFWYAFMAIARQGEIQLVGLRNDSIQGDAVCEQIFSQLGVRSDYRFSSFYLSPCEITTTDFQYNFIDCIDLVPAVLVACVVLNINARLTGLTNLKFKESDRLSALAQELNKIFSGCLIIDSPDTLIIVKHAIRTNQDEIVELHSHGDHRLAMAFSLIAMQQSIQITDSDVVRKSYPEWWDHMRAAGIQI